MTRGVTTYGWRLYLGAMLVTLALYYAFFDGPLAQAVVYQLVGFCAALAVVLGALVHRPGRRIHLWLLAGGIGLFSLGDAIYFFYDFVLETERPYPSIADWVYLTGAGALVLAMLLLVRSRQRPSISDVLDGAIVLSGSGLLVWFALIAPVARDGSSSLIARVVSSAYPTADLLIIVALAQLVLTPGARSFAFRAISTGAAMLLCADLAYGYQAIQGTYVDGSWVDAGWMLANIAWAAAVLHPSIRELHVHSPLRDTRLTRKRLLLLAAASLLTPAAITIFLEGRNSLDVGVIAATSAITTLLAFGRMAFLFREHAQAITALREAVAGRAVADALRDSHERFESAARALDCAIYEWSPAQGSVVWTEGLRTAFGHAPAEVPTTLEWWLAQVHPADAERLAERSRAYAAGAVTFDAQYRLLHGDGGYRFVWDRSVVTFNAEGRPARVVGGIVDVTERRKLELALRQSQKMEAVGLLAGGIAHDFNNLLMAISGNAEILAQRPAGDEGWRGDVAEIRRAADRAAELTRQLLTFSSPQTPQEDAVQLNTLVLRTETMLRRLLGPSVEIEAAIEPDSGAVLCDAGQLEQVLVNLALNARDAMPGGGRLRIATRRLGPGEGPPELAGRACGILSVTDTGTGIDPELIGRIFEPFFTTKDVGKGTGLGLATVYGIVQSAGGTVVVSSELGRGTAFDVYLPWAEGGALAAAVPEAPVAARGTEEILLVDDEQAVRDVVATMLERQGYRVTQAQGPLEALALLEGGECSPQLVVTDLLMPKLTGWKLAERVLELRPATSFIFISGFTGASEPADGELGCEWRFVQKPFAADDLVRAVRELLDSARLAA